MILDLLEKEINMDFFKIVKIERIDAETVQATVRLADMTWARSSRLGALDSLYKVISHDVARCGVKGPYDSASDGTNAVNGMKFVRLFYFDKEWIQLDNVIRVDFINKKRIAA